MSSLGRAVTEGCYPDADFIIGEPVRGFNGGGDGMYFLQ